MAQDKANTTVQRERKTRRPEQLERNLLERDISKNLELDPCKEITTEPWKNESRSKSIQPCQLSGSSSYPSFHTNPQMPMWTQNLCPFHQSNQSL